ncbi:hypothetical protein TRFO_28174 [Tritrichomonas foetus]|uniref:Uncharacterized protein n=1 Tax=Tritrichomonas foetus TaxID=1144522 RepID=A0A1J4JZE1_9EUKA|nr:hypothetical protein TRFO_28174 [Tritrichomonas foetus]|eukprot:OHT04347.1 hypothetical protein TRFO_28174 [Tritrichomonas foetus]
MFPATITVGVCSPQLASTSSIHTSTSSNVSGFVRSNNMITMSDDRKYIFTRERYSSCPAVSQKLRWRVWPSNSYLTDAKEAPVVEVVFSSRWLFTIRLNKVVLPTVEDPHKTIFVKSSESMN